MSEYTIELSSEPINGSLNYKRKFNMTGDIGGGGVLAVNVTYNEQTELYTCDKTAGEIYAACPAVVFVSGTTENMNVTPLASYGFGDSGYTFGDMLDTEYTASAADDFPSAGSGPK